MIWKLACWSENFLRKSLRVRYGPFILQLTPLPLDNFRWFSPDTSSIGAVRQKSSALVDFVRQSNMVRALQVTCHFVSKSTNRITPETTPWEGIGMPYTQSIDIYLLSKYYLKNTWEGTRRKGPIIDMWWTHVLPFSHHGVLSSNIVEPRLNSGILVWQQSPMILFCLKVYDTPWFQAQNCTEWAFSLPALFWTWSSIHFFGPFGDLYWLQTTEILYSQSRNMLV